jgi:branched-subunit amino acid aminotransferase/4-amino-4-deoxychorismate lyase
MLVWSDGQIIPEETLAISASDRTFEHGMGLFETLRTWHGGVPLLPRHLSRLEASASALGLPLERRLLPDESTVRALCRANEWRGEARVRITLTGGRDERSGCRLWMRLDHLPDPIEPSGAVVAEGCLTVAHDDSLARHKTLNYWSKRLAYERARAQGADEVLLATPDGRVWEGSRTNLFLIHGDTLVTPDLSGPLIPGVVRALVLDHAATIGLAAREKDVFKADFSRADEVFLTNSVRGLIDVGRIGVRSISAARTWTLRLRSRIENWLREESTRL